ncbi:acyltransferase [Caballeronia sp. LjRoot34]|uniref:acyltransferase family protein n=1 Tax=Caballeronia sp. LjRoot34 TaxID=3342325 RepID=UPI003ECD42A8
MIKKRPFHASYIDGLRAIAVLSVIAFHLNPNWLPGGFAGVDVFFVISGFVVAISVSDIGRANLTRFLTYFYARRLIRIAPALVVCLFVTFVASALLIPHAWLSDTNNKTGLSAFLGLSNFVLAANAGNYFSPIVEFNPFTHTWSLAVEEQFYFVFPWLFILWLRSSRAASICLFATAVIASFICAIWLGRTDKTQAFYMIWSRFWQLGAGVLLFQIMHIRGHSFREKSPYLAWCGMAADLGLCLLVMGLIVARSDAAPFPAGILPVAGTAMILGTLHGRKGGISHSLLTSRIMVFVGKISYSLYLWHWPVFVLFRWTVGLDSYVWQFAALSTATVLAILSYYFVEQPPRKAAQQVQKPRLIAAGAVLVFSGCLLSGAVSYAQPRISLSTVSRNMDVWYPEGPHLAHGNNGCSVGDSSKRSFNDGVFWINERSRCDAPVTFPHNVFVLGDSHAIAYTGMLKQFAIRTGAKVYVYNKAGCPFISLLPVPGREVSCQAFDDAAVADMLPLIKPGDIVFLASLRLPRMVDQWAFFGVDFAKNVMFSPIAEEHRQRDVENAIPILRQIAARGARIVFEAPTPMLESIPYRCADWFNRENPICSQGMSVPRSLLDDLRAPVLASYKQMQTAIPGLSVWDPMIVLCPGYECHAYRDGKPLLFDGDHLSYFSNMLLLPSFSAFVSGDPFL